MKAALVERFWWAPAAMPLVLFTAWLATGRQWDPYRVGVPVIIGLMYLGATRFPRRQIRFLKPAGLVAVLAGAIAALTTHDGTLQLPVALLPVATCSVIAVSTLWVRGFFAQGAARLEVADVWVVAGAVHALSGVMAAGVWSTLTPWRYVLLEGTLVSQAFATGVVVVLVFFAPGASVSAWAACIGIVVATTAQVWYLCSVLYGQHSLLALWGVVAGFSLFTAGLWHRDVQTTRNSVAGLFRPKVSGFILMAALASGVLAIVIADSNVLLKVVGALAVCVAGARAAFAVHDSWDARIIAARELTREAVVRDDERRVLKRLLHDDVLQPLVVASWLTTRPAGREAVLASEHELRELLILLEPEVPEVVAFESRLQRMITAAGHQTTVVVSTEDPGGIDAVQVLLWQVLAGLVLSGLEASIPNRLTVSLTADREMWTATVIDDGDGVAVRDTRLASLNGVRSRLLDAGGWMHIGMTATGGGYAEAGVPVSTLLVVADGPLKSDAPLLEGFTLDS